MIELVKYIHPFKEETLFRISKFFGFHSSLLHQDTIDNIPSLDEAESTLTQWLNISNELYIIFYDHTSVGFLHIGYRGECVAWIEDIYVEELYRNMGIGTKAIELAEAIILTNPHYTSICFDVALRNESALKIYHKLGYDNVSLITVRKEFGENKRNKIENILGLDFKY